MRHLWIAFAGVAMLGACAQPNRSAAVSVNSSGDVSGGVAVESTSPRNRNVSTTVAVGTGGAGVAVGGSNMSVGLSSGSRPRGGFGMWF